MYCKLVVPALIGLILITGCKMSGDQLAVYKDGGITRGEFYEWIESRNIIIDQIKKNKSQQVQLLKNMATDKITASMAADNGYDKNPGFKEWIEFSERNYLAGSYKKSIAREIEYEEDLSRISIIKFNTKNAITGADDRQVIAEKMIRANQAIEELRAGAKFSDIAKKYSEDASKFEGGNAGYVFRGMKGVEFYGALERLNVGEYTPEPVQGSGAIYIAKLEEKLTVNNKNLKNKLKEEKYFNYIKGSLENYVIQNYENKIAGSLAAVFNGEALEKGNDDSAVFTVADKTFRNSDLKKAISLVAEKRNIPEAAQKELKLKKDFAMRLFKEELFIQDAIKSGYDKDEQYLKMLENTRRSILAESYRNDVILKDIKVSADEIREEMDRIKKTVLKGKKSHPPVSAAEIEKRLGNRLKIEKRKQWDSKLAAEYEFKINENKLEGK